MWCHTCSSTLTQRQYIMFGLKYSFGHLWFGYCKRWGLCSIYSVESNRTEQAIMMISVGKLYKFTTAQRSLRGDKKNWRPLNQYRLSSSRGGHLRGQTEQTPHPHHPVCELQHVFWHMSPMETDAITSPQGFRSKR